jgi:hypothetical protein
MKRQFLIVNLLRGVYGIAETEAAGVLCCGHEILAETSLTVGSSTWSSIDWRSDMSTADMYFSMRLALTIL